jgi:uracil-DNA glycosylase
MSLFLDLPPYWQAELADLQFKVDAIESTLTNEANAGIRVLPNYNQVFRALEVMPWESKVVIVGQDPYPNLEHACGLSFSVPAHTKPIAGSLRNIFAEIKDDTGRPSVASTGDLTPWVKQGVVLINRVLTVRKGESGSHFNLGWQEITERVIKKYAEFSVGLLFGGTAKQVKHLFWDDQVITTVHPSPLSAHKGFLGSKPFTRTNAILKSMGKDAIQW